MGRSVYNIVKAPVGWVVFLDRTRIGGVYGTKEAALEAAAVTASSAMRGGQGVQINVPGDDEPNEQDESWPKQWDRLLK